jgi:hypothetical protein
MNSRDNSVNRVAVVQLNAELRRAQLELLSAQCAADQLRIRFVAKDIAGYGQRDVLRSALGSVTALHNYYGSIAKEIQSEDAPREAPPSTTTFADHIANLESCLVEIDTHLRRLTASLAPEPLLAESQQQYFSGIREIAKQVDRMRQELATLRQEA